MLRRSTSAFQYVNRSLGTFGLPVRLGVPPEITLLMLRAVEWSTPQQASNRQTRRA